jgi:hypothetical protein
VRHGWLFVPASVVLILNRLEPWVATHLACHTGHVNFCPHWGNFWHPSWQLFVAQTMPSDC